MNWRVLTLLATALFILLVILREQQKASPQKTAKSESPTGTSPGPLSPLSPLQKTFQHEADIDFSHADSRFTRYLDGTVYLHQPIEQSRLLADKTRTARKDLEVIDQLLTHYRTVFKENPVGTDNWEFATALAGDNAKKLVILDPALLTNRELLDRWGTPYRFHPISSDLLEIRSAGEDQTFFTQDDLLLPEPKDDE